MKPMTALNDLIGWIHSHDDFAIVPHLNPDGDAIGSVLTLNDILVAIGKRSYVVSTDAAPDMYAFLPGIDTIQWPNDMPYTPRAFIYVDVASRDRAAVPIGSQDNACPLAVIDHHPTNAGFGDASLVDPNVSATGELIYDVMKALGESMNLRRAAWLFTAIAMDTGNFSYSNTTSKSLRIAAECLEAGLDVSEVNRLLFRNRTLSRVKLLGYAIDHVCFAQNGQIAYSVLPDGAFEACHAKRDETEGIVSYLNEIHGVGVSILFVEDRGIKVSFRSGGKVNVGCIAAEMGGGGHARAAGVTLTGSMDDVVQRVVAEISKRLS